MSTPFLLGIFIINGDIRKYKNQPVEKEKILRILKAGMQSPSACNQQPWEFYVVTNKEKRKHYRSLFARKC